MTPAALVISERIRELGQGDNMELDVEEILLDIITLYPSAGHLALTTQLARKLTELAQNV